MRSSLVMSLIGATSMALALLVGCGDDDAKPATSKAGQSCARTADCADGLSCISNVCYKTAPPPSGGEAGDSSVTPPAPLPRGGEGESCNSRLDCADGLGCFNNRCTTAAETGEGGATGGTGVQLGARGESCRVNGDCGKELVCVPSANAAGVGVCDLANFGIKPTGLTCSGECTKAEDCCQLPISLHSAGIKSCEDIAKKIADDSIDCDAPAAGIPATLCFQQATYCECGDDTWSCDDDTHQCKYELDCVVAVGADVPTGCPSITRLGNAVPACNPDSKTCIGATATPGCTNDNSCKDKQIIDSVVGDLCSTGECTCYAATKQCYRKCARDIDCAAGQACDTAKTKLCVPVGACTNDTQCAIANGSLAWKCNEGTCAKSCAVDRDCSGTGLGAPAVGSGFTGMVCGSDKFCASVVADCEEGSQCAPLANGMKPFCVETMTGAGTTVSSSVTN